MQTNIQSNGRRYENNYRRGYRRFNELPAPVVEPPKKPHVVQCETCKDSGKIVIFNGWVRKHKNCPDCHPLG